MRVDDYCAAVIAAARLDGTAQAVLWMIAHHVNRQTAETFVSLSTIAEKCHLSRRTVQRATAELRDAAVFSIVERPGRSTIYRFPIHPALSTPRSDLTRVESVDPGQIRPGGRTDLSRDPGQICPPNHVPNQVHNRAPDPVTDEHDPTPSWFKDRVARHTDAKTDRDDPQPRMMWEVSM